MWLQLPPVTWHNEFDQSSSSDKTKVEKTAGENEEVENRKRRRGRRKAWWADSLPTSTRTWWPLITPPLILTKTWLTNRLRFQKNYYVGNFFPTDHRCCCSYCIVKVFFILIGAAFYFIAFIYFQGRNKCLCGGNAPIAQSEHVQHKRVWNRNYVWLLHSYEIYVLGCKNYSLTLQLFMHASPFSYHELNTNNAKTIQNQKPFKNQNFNCNKLCIHIITLYKWRCFSRSQTLTYIPTKRKLVKKLPKVYPPYGSPCDSTINHKET